MKRSVDINERVFKNTRYAGNVPVGVVGEKEQRRHDHVEDRCRQEHHLKQPESPKTTTKKNGLRAYIRVKDYTRYTLLYQ